MRKKFKELDDNSINIITNVFATFIIKGGALVVSFLTTPSFIRYFDNTQVLGLWFTLLSVLSWILTFDLGIGNGLRNQLIKPLVEKDYLKAKKYISSAYLSVGLVVLISLIVFILSFDKINWNTIFNISTKIVSRNNLMNAVFIVFSGIMIQFFLKLITSILYALQKSAVNNLITLFNSIVILIFVNIFRFNSVEESLINLAIVYSISVNLPLLITSIVVFSTSLKKASPNIRYFRKKLAKNILKLGASFLWIQVMYMILNGTNEFLITWFVGPEAVVEYQIYNRIFSLVGTVFTIALTPIWSAVTKSLAENNFIWIKKTFKLLSKLSVVAIVGTFIIVPFLQPLFNIWLGSSTIEVNYIYAVIFAIVASINIWNTVLSTIANGLGELKPQAILFTIAVAIKLPLAWLLVNIYPSWISIMVASIISMLAYCVFQPILLNLIINKKISK